MKLSVAVKFFVTINTRKKLKPFYFKKSNDNSSETQV